MVGIVVVSHSEAVARGVVALAREMSPPELALEAAGGIGEEGVLGTSAELVRLAIQRAMSADGVLVLMDLGSALMSAELALELLEGATGPVRLSAAPLVEGAVAAAAAAGGGAALDQVATEAEGALAMKVTQIAGDPPGMPQGAPVTDGEAEFTPEVEVELTVANEVGLHARPAARFVQTVSAHDAEVLVARAGTTGQPVNARSLTNVITLGARRGDTVRVWARGPQAREVAAALQALAANGFGDGLPAPAAGTTLRGIPATAGVAVGLAQLLKSPSPASPQRAPGDPADELARLERGLSQARTTLLADRDRLRATVGAAEAEIFDAHLALLEDEALLEPARAAIAGGAAAEAAVRSAAEQVAATYRGLDQPLLAERASDVLDVGQRLVGAIAGASAELPPPAGVVVAEELTPSQTARLHPDRVTGIVTARGSATAHAAIIARALGIPAVVGLGDCILRIAPGTPLLVDGDAGTVTIAPSEQAVTGVRTQQARAQERAALALAHAERPLLLAGGERVEVFANLSGMADAQRAVRFGAEGVGLLRTEFLFLERSTLPDEDEQTETLSRIAAALGGRPLVVRTLDAGADKPLVALPMPAEANPSLGVRGIRVGLRQPELLATQLRAVLRVAAEHPLKLMLPMVATLDEVLAARELLEQARTATGVDAPLEFGITVEVPAAALMAEQLAPHVDFFSLGTNDLTQYTMAAERGNSALEPLLADPQPAVLRLVHATVQAAQAHGRWVGVCGELAADPACAVLLAGLGVTELSMTPSLIPGVKAALRGLELPAMRRAALRALDESSARAARTHALELLDTRPSARRQ